MYKKSLSAFIAAMVFTVPVSSDETIDSSVLQSSDLKPKYSRESIVLGLRRLGLHYYSYETLSNYENILAVFSNEIVGETRRAHGHIVPSYILASGYNLGETIRAIKRQVNLEDRSTLGVTLFKRESISKHIFSNLLAADSEVILEPGDLLVFTRIHDQEIELTE